MKPINQRENCSYFLPAPPHPVKHVPAIHAGGVQLPEEGKVLWSSHRPVPPIGAEIRVAMNGIGEATVTSYFVEHGWLGLHVATRHPISLPPHRAGCRDALVFGNDLAAVQPWEGGA